jgi:hypothetical protein
MHAPALLRQPSRTLVITAAAVPLPWPSSPTPSACAASCRPPAATRSSAYPAATS